MAKEPASFPKDLKLSESRDFSFLKKRGIELTQELSGDIWTDYNEHDPGITILEQLCYSLTEIAYKTGMDIEDILYAKRNQPFDGEDNAFFTPDKVFPSAPLTMYDYRKLLIDRLHPYLNNAWLLPLEHGAFGVNMSGLFKVNLLLTEEAYYDRERIIEDARSLLSGYRNLCEDLDEISVLKPLRITLNGDIEISATAVVENVMANILTKINYTFLPPVFFRSRQELEAGGYGLEKIYEGPLPLHGFILNEDLKASGDRPEWYVMNPTKLGNLIREVSGVVRVNNLEIGIYIDDHKIPDGFTLIEKLKGDGESDGFYITTNLEHLPKGHEIRRPKNPRKSVPPAIYKLREDDLIPEGYYPFIDTENILRRSTFICFIDGMKYEYEINSVRKNINRIVAENYTQFSHPVKYPEHKPRSKRSVSELERYYSLQYTFPQIYGIGPYGVSSDKPIEWKTHARHLKTYLYFYEQILADFLSQLTHFYKLFSLQDNVERTYFHQVPTVPNLDMVIGESRDKREFQEVLDKISLEFDPILQRRNRAMNHLLARFGEQFLSEAYHAIMRKVTEENQEKFEAELLKAKLRFLKNIVELGEERGRGRNYLIYEGGKAPTDFIMHSTALEKRIAMIFNMKDHQYLSLTESIRESEGVEFGKKRKSKASEGKSAFNFSLKNQDVFRIVLEEGLDRDNFEIVQDENEGNWNIILKTLPGKEREKLVFTGNSEEQCENAILVLQKKLRELNTESEGFHILEHVLIRPVGTTMFSWYLTLEGRVFLQTPVLDKEDYAQEFLDALLRRAGDPENYLTTGNNEDGYMLVLTEEDGSIIAYNEGYLDEMSAERERDRIVLLLPQMKDPESGIEIRKEQSIPKGALLADDFYSLKISFILPSWPVRFRNEKFRILFEQVVKLSVPSHTTVECYWLDHAEMNDFEKVYLEWKAEKAKEKPNQPWLDELSWCLVILLKMYNDPNDPQVIKEIFTLRDKHGLSMKLGDE